MLEPALFMLITRRHPLRDGAISFWGAPAVGRLLAFNSMGGKINE